MSTGSGKSPSELSDEELILRVKDRDDAALEELYRRHVPSALSFAKSLVGNDFDADDIISEAFFKVVRAIQRGGGPEGPFRSYLLRAVKTSTADHWTTLSRQDLLETPVETSQEEQGFDRVLNEQDRELAGAAYASLPARWQTVLWHVDVEGEPPRRVGPLLGLAPNAVSAMAARARKGLRQAYLEAYVRSSLEESCKPYLALLAKSTLEGLPPGENLRLQKHLDECAACASAVAALADVRSTMRRAVGPWFLGLIPAPLVLTPGATSTALSPSGGPSKGASSAQVASHSAGMGVGPWAATIAIVASVASAAVAVATGLEQTNQATLDTADGSAGAGPMAQNTFGGITALSAPVVTSNSPSGEPSRTAAEVPRQAATQAPRPVPTQSPPLSSTAPDVLPLNLFAIGSFDLPPVGPPSASAPASVSPSQPLQTPTPTLLPVPGVSPTNTVLPTATPSSTPTTALPTATPTPPPPPPPPPPTATPTPTPVVTPTPEPTCSWWWWWCLQ